MKWDELSFWSSEDWEGIQKNLDRLDKEKESYCPDREDIFASMDAVDLEDVKVAIFGQDPYPNKKYATGIAFSIPEEVKEFPGTLCNLFKEYCNDLHYPYPLNGNLLKWTYQGVFLWNVIPTCMQGKPLSHYNWWGWNNLTKEIIHELNKRCVLMVFLGGVAREFAFLVDRDLSSVIELSHPAPRGSLKSKTPFTGSRMFSTINSYLAEDGAEPIDWCLTSDKGVGKNLSYKEIIEAKNARQK